MSIIVASLLLLQPTLLKTRLNYGFIAATTATGTYLVVTTNVNVLHVCLTGLTYLSVVAALTIAAQYRLKKIAADNLNSSPRSQQVE